MELTLIRVQAMAARAAPIRCTRRLATMT